MPRSISALAGLAVAVVLITGCSAPDTIARGDDSRPWNWKEARSFFVALDTSASAQIMHKQFGKIQQNHLMTIPMDATLRLFRFDSSPAEVSSGQPPARETDAAKLLKSVFAHRSKEDGTNMALLIELLDKHVDEVRPPVEITIYTDAGIENMTAMEKAAVRAVTGRWATDDRVLGVRVVGLRDGWREPVRELLRLPPIKFAVDGRSVTDTIGE